jgi:ATP-dependent DNA helicase DinG
MSTKGVNNHRLAKKLQEQGEKLFRCLIYSAEHTAPDDEVDRLPASLSCTYPQNEQNSVAFRNGMTASNYLINIAGISADLAAALNDTIVSKMHEERKSKVLWRLSCMSDKAASLRKHTELIHWLEKSNEGEATAHALCAIPKDLDARLFGNLWNNDIPIILTSGTLSAAGDFTRIKQTLGLDRIPQHKLFDVTMPSPFDYRNNTLLYISEDVPFPDNKDKHYVNSVADEIQRLVTASHGHAAVLFTSYNTMGQVHAILASRSLPYPLLRLERGGVHAIERFKQSDNGILFASGSLWEGIDIPGDVLSMLIIVRLPFAFPDPIGDYERELCGDMETYKTRAIIPDMLVKLKQGHGRLIRSESDTGVVAILDSRANYWGAYRRRVLAALPECDVTSDMAAVEKFIYDRKPSAYFSVKA